MRAWKFLTLGTLAALTACGGEPETPEQSAPTAADTVQAAMAQYDPAGFDTITWATAEDAIVRGSVVFSYSCAKCHGRHGEGNGNFVTQGDTLRPPDITVTDWRFLDDREGLREYIYVGSDASMPHWGLEGLRYKDIDAVSAFLIDGIQRR